MVDDSSNGGSGDGVVRLAALQRAAEANEPVCVICGQYGEYICDVTDQDVCSLECRDRCRAQQPQNTTIDSAGVADPKYPSSPVENKPQSPQNVDHKNDDEDLRRQLGIRVQCVGNDSVSCSPPWKSFNSLPVKLRDNVATCGFLYLTPVQMQTVPVVLTGRHALVNAPTGTGKTAAFLIPMVAKVMETQKTNGRSVPLAIVLAPMRELAIQIEEEAKKLMKGIPHMKTALLIGGVPLPPQLHRIRQGVQLMVGTPGRMLEVLIQCEEEGTAPLLEAVGVCVIDEVDMMVTAGFIDAVTTIVSQLDACQLVCTSATITDQVEELVGRLVADAVTGAVSYVKIQVGVPSDTTTNSKVSINPNIDQAVIWVEENAKKKELFQLMQSHPTDAVLVFVDSRAGADLLADAIQQQTNVRGKAASFHAGKSQDDRLRVLEDFVNEDVRVLVSTNVLGRGIDILSADQVVVFDAPKTIEEYVHLVGRVGRQALSSFEGEEAIVGRSTLYVNNRDVGLFEDLVKVCRQSRVRVPEAIYTSIRAKHGPPQQQTTVAHDQSKRAFYVVSKTADVDASTTWEHWKSQNKRARLSSSSH